MSYCVLWTALSHCALQFSSWLQVTSCTFRFPETNVTLSFLTQMCSAREVGGHLALWKNEKVWCFIRLRVNLRATILVCTVCRLQEQHGYHLLAGWIHVSSCKIEHSQQLPVLFLLQPFFHRIPFQTLEKDLQDWRNVTAHIRRKVHSPSMLCSVLGLLEEADNLGAPSVLTLSPLWDIAAETWWHWRCAQVTVLWLSLFSQGQSADAFCPGTSLSPICSWKCIV